MAQAGFPPSGYGMPIYGPSGPSRTTQVVGGKVYTWGASAVPPRPPAAGYPGAAGYPTPSTGYPIWGAPKPGANAGYARQATTGPSWAPNSQFAADALDMQRRRRRQPNAMTEPVAPAPMSGAMY